VKIEEENIKPHIGIANIERRTHPRFNVDLPIEYHLVQSPVLGAGRAVNASEGGLLIYLREKIEIGQFLRMKLFFTYGANLHAIELLSEVVWKDVYPGREGGDYRYGIRFADIAPENLEKLRVFFRSLSE
jgi:hypothetical protein